MNRSDRTLDRFGAAAGIAAVILLVAIITVSAALPPPNHSLADITRSASDDSAGILRGAYLGALFSGTLIVFGAAMARLRRSEGAAGGWWIVALAGIAGTSVGLVFDMLLIMFVRAVGHGVHGDALWVGYPSGPDGVLIAIPLAVFLLGAGIGARETRALPGWLAWLGIGLAAAFTIGAAGVAGDEVDGGVLGFFLLLGYAGLLVWIVGSSISMLRRSSSPVPATATAFE